MGEYQEDIPLYDNLARQHLAPDGLLALDLPNPEAV